MKYIYEQTGWPNSTGISTGSLRGWAEVRHRQGRFLGRMEELGFPLKNEAMLQTFILDVLKSSEIEGKSRTPARSAPLSLDA